MERLISDISDSWKKAPWNWGKHHRNLRRAMKRYTDSELIDAAQCFQDRRSSIYRLDMWIAVHLLTEGFMSDDGFSDFTDCLIATPFYDSISGCADSLIDHPEFTGYTEAYFGSIPYHIYDRRKRARKYTFLISEHITGATSNNFPRFDRTVAERLVPRLTARYGDEVVWRA